MDAGREDETDAEVSFLSLLGITDRRCGIQRDNPYAALSLLRAYSENAAAILYLSDHTRLLNRP